MSEKFKVTLKMQFLTINNFVFQEYFPIDFFVSLLSGFAFHESNECYQKLIFNNFETHKIINETGRSLF